MAKANWLGSSLLLASASTMAAGIGPLPTMGDEDSVVSADLGYYYQRTDWQGIDGSLASDALKDITRDAPYLKLNYMFHKDWQASVIYGMEGISNNPDRSHLAFNHVSAESFIGAQLSGILYRKEDISVGAFAQYTSHGDYSIKGEYQLTPVDLHEYQVQVEDLTDVMAGVLVQKDYQVVSAYGGVMYHNSEADYAGTHDASAIAGTLEVDTNLGALAGIKFQMDPQWSVNLEYQNRGNHGVAISANYRFKKPDPQVVVVEKTRTIEVPAVGPDAYDNRIYFDHGSSAIKVDEMLKVRELARFMEDNPNSQVIIEGHCDCTGSELYNENLSEDRANAVKRFLVEYYAIDEERILLEGYGERLPADTNDTEEGRSNNRRVRVFASR